MSRISEITHEVVFQGRSKNECWFSPCAGLIPPAASKDHPRIMAVATQLTGNDIGPWHYAWTHDMGRRWSNPAQSQGLQKVQHDDFVFEGAWLAPNYHAVTGTFFGLGNTIFTRDEAPSAGLKGELHTVHTENGRTLPHKRSIIYAIWDDDLDDFRPWQRVDVAQRFQSLGHLTCSNASQICQCGNGDILMPVMAAKPAHARQVGSIRMTFDGQTMELIDAGNTFGKNVGRGLVEPSMIEVGGRYLMTIRSEYGDHTMYHAESDDGIHWNDYEPWCWDTGERIDTENTQQHWLKQNDTLYLVYTRQSELNNGVFRSRAPLYIAQVKLDTCRLIRETEQIVLPENGARMGNFCTLSVTDNQAWVLTGEWLQQLVTDHKPGMRFYQDATAGKSPYNRIQYVGDLLLARINFS